MIGLTEVLVVLFPLVLSALLTLIFRDVLEWIAAAWIGRGEFDERLDQALWGASLILALSVTFGGAWGISTLIWLGLVPLLLRLLGGPRRPRDRGVGGGGPADRSGQPQPSA